VEIDSGLSARPGRTGILDDGLQRDRLTSVRGRQNRRPGSGRTPPPAGPRRTTTAVTLAPLRYGALAAATDALERLAREAGHWPVAGVDEAGRGPLAGPVVAAAVGLPPGFLLPELAGSKALPLSFSYCTLTRTVCAIRIRF